MTEPTTEPKRLGQTDDVVASLVRLTGEPRALPEGAEERVRAQVHAAWRSRVRRRRQRAIAVAASVAIIASALALLRGGVWLPASSPAGPLATLKTIQGEGLIGDGAAVKVGESLGEGLLKTGAGRAALELADGSSLRLDRETQVDLLGPSRLRLEDGAIYLDAASEEAFTVETPFGDVRDLGTQFEVRLDADELQVRVREGRVDVYGPTGRQVAEAGVELRLSHESVSRRTVARHGEPWRAYVEMAPTFDIEGATLAAYLKWLQRETGWQIEYRDPSIALSATAILLHGSLQGLSVVESPLPVLQTCGLGGRVENGSLEIFSLQENSSTRGGA